MKVRCQSAGARRANQALDYPPVRHLSRSPVFSQLIHTHFFRNIGVGVGFGYPGPLRHGRFRFFTEITFQKGLGKRIFARVFQVDIMTGTALALPQYPPASGRMTTGALFITLLLRMASNAPARAVGTVHHRTQGPVIPRGAAFERMTLLGTGGERFMVAYAAVFAFARMELVRKRNQRHKVDLVVPIRRRNPIRQGNRAVIRLPSFQLRHFVRCLELVITGLNGFLLLRAVTAGATNGAMRSFLGNSLSMAGNADQMRRIGHGEYYFAVLFRLRLFMAIPAAFLRAGFIYDMP